MSTVSSMEPAEIAEAIRDITDAAQDRMHSLAQQLNSVSLTQAMQEGYRRACIDHGLPPPDFVDPAKLWGLW